MVLGYGFLGRSGLIFVVFWVSIVLTGFGGGSGWMVLGELWDLRFGGGALAGSVRLCGCVCVCVYQRRKKMMSLTWFCR